MHFWHLKHIVWSKIVLLHNMEVEISHFCISLAIYPAIFNFVYFRQSETLPSYRERICIFYWAYAENVMFLTIICKTLQQTDSLKVSPVAGLGIGTGFMILEHKTMRFAVTFKSCRHFRIDVDVNFCIINNSKTI